VCSVQGDCGNTRCAHITGAYTCSSDTSSSLTGDEQVLQPIFRVQQSHQLERVQHSLTEQTVYVFVTDSMCARACVSVTSVQSRTRRSSSCTTRHRTFSK
jgi:hypothetical protein